MKWFLEFLLAMILFAFFLHVAEKWMQGCGETYVDAYGVRHNYPCD